MQKFWIEANSHLQGGSAEESVLQLASHQFAETQQATSSDGAPLSTKPRSSRGQCSHACVPSSQTPLCAGTSTAGSPFTPEQLNAIVFGVWLYEGLAILSF